MSKEKKKIVLERNCRVCDAPTETIFNISFSAASICESCANSIFLQQAQWYVQNNKPMNKPIMERALEATMQLHDVNVKLKTLIMKEMNKPITEESFAETIQGHFQGNVKRDIAEDCFELAKQMAFSFSKFKWNYQRIESQNWSLRTKKHGMVSWIGHSDAIIFEAYLKGEQLEAEWMKELKDKNKSNEQG